MNSTIQRPPITFQIVFACLIGGFVSLLSNPEGTTHWTDKFWIISITSHCVLIATTFGIYHEKELRLDRWTGLFNAFTLALICSVTVLLLFVLGPYVPLVLIFSGRALLTSFVASAVLALLRTFN